MSDDPVTLGRDEIERGLMVAHNNAAEQSERLTKLSAHVYALTELLTRDRVVQPNDLVQLRTSTYEGMLAKMPVRWVTARVSSNEIDKRDPEGAVTIDCASRLPLCRAACCRLSFYLDNQDLEEGVVRWDLARPYHIKQRSDGYCVHCDREEKTCGVWAQRPRTCRVYDCRGDRRIWQDFDARIPNPALAAAEER